jgi:hypothetical protein
MRHIHFFAVLNREARNTNGYKKKIAFYVWFHRRLVKALDGRLSFFRLHHNLDQLGISFIDYWFQIVRLENLSKLQLQKQIWFEVGFKRSNEHASHGKMLLMIADNQFKESGWTLLGRNEVAEKPPFLGMNNEKLPNSNAIISQWEHTLPMIEMATLYLEKYLEVFPDFAQAYFYDDIDERVFKFAFPGQGEEEIDLIFAETASAKNWLIQQLKSTLEIMPIQTGRCSVVIMNAVPWELDFTEDPKREFIKKVINYVNEQTAIDEVYINLYAEDSQTLLADGVFQFGFDSEKSPVMSRQYVSMLGEASAMGYAWRSYGRQLKFLHEELDALMGALGAVEQ